MTVACDDREGSGSMRHGGGRRDNGLNNWWLLGFGAVGVDLVGFGGWWWMGRLFFFFGGLWVWVL